jgi:hypothetical protein
LVDHLQISQADKEMILEKFQRNFFYFKIIEDDKPLVDFEKFKTIYSSFKLNIYDLVDLIFGYLILYPYSVNPISK